METVKYLKLLSLCIVAYQAGMVLPAFSQNNLNPPIGTANTIGEVSNFNAGITQFPSANRSSSSTGTNLSTGVLLPRGGRATQSALRGNTGRALFARSRPPARLVGFKS